MKTVTRQWILLGVGLTMTSVWLYAYFFSPPGIAYSGPSRMHITQTRAGILLQGLNDFKNEFGNYPSGENAIVIKLLLKVNPKGKMLIQSDGRSPSAISEMGEYVDAWGIPFRIELSVTNSPIVRSAGRDKIFGSKDDLSFDGSANDFIRP